MKIVFKINTLEEERQRIKMAEEKLAWYIDRGYIVAFPKISLKEEYNYRDYEIRISEMKRGWEIIQEKFFLEMKKLFNSEIKSPIQVSFTKYGVGGSYSLSNKVIINVSDEYRSIVNYYTIAHEVIHLYLEPLIQKYKVGHWEKERIVDLISSKIFKTTSKQKIPIETKKIDNVFESFYPNIERICLDLSE